MFARKVGREKEMFVEDCKDAKERKERKKVRMKAEQRIENSEKWKGREEWEEEKSLWKWRENIVANDKKGKECEKGEEGRRIEERELIKKRRWWVIIS